MPARLSCSALLLALGVMSLAGCGRTKLALLSTFSDANDEGTGAKSSGGRGGDDVRPSKGGRSSGAGGEQASGGESSSVGGEPGSTGGVPGSVDGGAGGEPNPGAGGDASEGGADNGGGAAGEASGGAAGETSSGGAGGEGATCSITTIGAPGEIDWLNTYGGVGTSAPKALAVDSQGNVIVGGDLGYILDLGDGDPLLSPIEYPQYLYYSNAYLAKLDANGNVLWAKALNSTGEAHVAAVTVDPDDNIVVAGTFHYDLDLDEDDPGAHVVSSWQAWCVPNGCNLTDDMFLAKYTPDGEVIWGHAYGDDSSEGIGGLACDSAGRIAVTGTFKGNLDFSLPNPADGSGPAGTTSETLQAKNCDAYLAELDADGNYLWSTSFGTDVNKIVCQRPEGLAVADNDDLILGGGYIGGDVTLSGDPADALPAVNSLEVLLARYASDGALVYARGWAASSNQYIADVALAPDGDIVTIGGFGNELTFDPDAPLVSAGSGDVFLARFDGQGNYVEGRAYGDGFDQRGTNVIVDDQGRITIGGRFSRSIDFGGTAQLVTTTNTYGDYDAFIVQLDSSLSAAWQFTLGSSGDETVVGLVKLCDGSAIAAGEYGAEATLLDGTTVPAHGGKDLWLSRLAP